MFCANPLAWWRVTSALLRAASWSSGAAPMLLAGRGARDERIPQAHSLQYQVGTQMTTLRDQLDQIARLK
jgi:hypothetical protein